MSGFKPIERANLPQSTVRHVVVSPKYRQVTDALNAIGVETAFVTPCDGLPETVSLHADMLFHHIGGNKFFVEKSQTSLYEYLQKIGFEVLKPLASLGGSYPNDVPLNCCRVADRLICNEKYAYQPLMRERKIVNCAQGYAKCSALVVDENSIVTDDVSIESAARQAGLDVLLVGKGDVVLDGLGYGFIGGCCGKISRDTVAFCGDINAHRDAAQIKAFLRNRGVETFSLFGGKLLDIGSIIPITENA